MVQVIYGDVLLLIDFCVDFFVLYTTGVLLRRKIRPICIGGAAFVGAIYSVAKVFINGNDIFDFFISLGVGLLMCYISFGGYKFLKTVLIFFGISAMVGGIMLALFFFLGSYHFDLFGNMRGYAYTHIPVWLFGLLAALSLIISWIFSHLGRESADKMEISAAISRNGNVKNVRLLSDSGNLVKEPISGKYVIMMKGKSVSELLSDAEYDAVKKGRSEFLLKNRFRMITAYGIDGNKKMYFAFLPDRIMLDVGKKQVEGDAYIAVCEEGAVFGANDGIVNPAVLF